MGQAMPDRVARQATKGFVGLTAGRAAALALQFVAFAITAAALGPAELGVYSFAVAFIGLFRFVTNFGFRGVVARDVAQAPHREDELVANLAWLRAGLGLLAWAAVVAIAQLAGFDPDQRAAAIVTGALLVLLALESFEISLEVRLRTGWIAVAEIVKSVLLVGGAVLLALGDRGVLAFLGLYVGANAVRLSLPALVAVRERSYAWRPRTEVWVGVARAAAFLGLAQLCIALYYRLDLLLLARFKPADDVGQYGAAYQFLETFVVLPGLAMVVLTPIISRSVVDGTDVLARRLRRVLHLVTLVALPVAVAGAMTAWRVLPTIPGFGEFEGAGVALSVLSPSTIAIFFGTVLSGVLVAAHRQRLLFWLSLAVLALNLVLLGVLIPPFSYVGAAAATSATEVVLAASSLLVVAHLLHVRWPLADAARATRASLVLAAVLAAGFVLPPVVQVVVGLVVYLAVLLPTGSLRWDDLGGLVAADGEPVEVVVGAAGAAGAPGDAAGPPAPSRAGAPRTIDLAGASPRVAWRALRGTGACRLRAEGGPGPWWLPVAARAAGCGPLTADAEVADGGVVRRLVHRWFVDPPSAAEPAEPAGAASGSAGTASGSAGAHTSADDHPEGDDRR